MSDYAYKIIELSMDGFKGITGILGFVEGKLDWDKSLLVILNYYLHIINDLSIFKAPLLSWFQQLNNHFSHSGFKLKPI
jgi:hypothetical protein